MITLEQIVKRLKATSGDPEAQSAAAAEFVVLSHPNDEREALNAALDAAAVLRWFDAEMLGIVLGITEGEASKRFDALKTLPFVERYRRGDHDLRNVQKSTRLGWRKHLAHHAPERFRTLSGRAAAFFADDPTPAGRIEWIYHLLVSEDDRGVDQ